MTSDIHEYAPLPQDGKGRTVTVSIGTILTITDFLFDQSSSEIALNLVKHIDVFYA